MKKLIAIAIYLIASLALSSVSFGKLALLPLSEMVKTAEVIALGKVIKVQLSNEEFEEFCFDLLKSLDFTNLRTKGSTKGSDPDMTRNCRATPQIAQIV